MLVGSLISSMSESLQGYYFFVLEKIETVERMETAERRARVKRIKAAKKAGKIRTPSCCGNCGCSSYTCRRNGTCPEYRSVCWKTVCSQPPDDDGHHFCKGCRCGSDHVPKVHVCWKSVCGKSHLYGEDHDCNGCLCGCDHLPRTHHCWKSVCRKPLRYAEMHDCDKSNCMCLYDKRSEMYQHWDLMHRGTHECNGCDCGDDHLPTDHDASSDDEQ